VPTPFRVGLVGNDIRRESGDEIMYLHLGGLVAPHNSNMHLGGSTQGRENSPSGIDRERELGREHTI